MASPDPHPPKPSTARSGSGRIRRGGGGGGYLVAAIVVALLAASVVFAPERWRSALGLVKPPSQDGEEPTAPGGVGGGLGSREQADATAGIGPVATRVDRSGASAPTAIVPKIPDRAPSLPPQAEKTYRDEPKAREYLAEAEGYFKTFKWQQAASSARRIAGLDAKPTTRSRAKDIETGAPKLEKLFVALDDRDELSRNFDTNPSLVQIGPPSSPMFAVPIVGDTTPPQAVDGDPLAWIETQRQVGPIWFMVKGSRQFAKSQLESGQIGEPRPVDVAAVIGERSANFDAKLAQLKNSDLSRQATAWYDAAKYAYQNRIDGRVAEMLDRALLIDPNLVATVREDRAGILFGSMMVHLKNRNRKQAEGFMAIIERKYKDTDNGRQARLSFEGRTRELLTAAIEAERRQRDAEKARREEARSRAAAKKAAGDTAAAKAIEDTVAPEPEQPASAPAASGDEGRADELAEKGRDILGQAMNMGPTPERNHKYHEAAKILSQAVAIYVALVTKSPDNEALSEKQVLTNKMLFSARKYASAF